MTAGQVKAKSGRKVWWRCSAGHEWLARVSSRSNGSGCPRCAGRLLTPLPDAIAAQWHPTLNGSLTPDQVSAGSARRVWWLCAVGHAWQTRPTVRVGGSGCPTCAGRPLTTARKEPIPSEVAAQWHPTRNGTLTPDQVTAGSNRRVWWQCSAEHEWEASVYNRARGDQCPMCAGYHRRPLPHDLTGEWHPTRNGTLTPDQVTAGSRRKVWWQCSAGHEWEAVIKVRIRSAGCPQCDGRLLALGAELMAQWHPTRNGTLTPDRVTAGSSRKVWWRCSAGHEWEATINNRSRGSGCRMCRARGVVRP